MTDVTIDVNTIKTLATDPWVEMHIPRLHKLLNRVRQPKQSKRRCCGGKIKSTIGVATRQAKSLILALGVHDLDLLKKRLNAEHIVIFVPGRHGPERHVR